MGLRTILPDMSTDSFKMTGSTQYLSAQRKYYVYQAQKGSTIYEIGGPSADELLIKLARMICPKYSIVFGQLTSIQRKFATHFRCNNCGLLPLYRVNLSHVKRVRCRKCGERIAFKARGKYGRLRKEVAFAFSTEMNGDAREFIR